MVVQVLVLSFLFIFVGNFFIRQLAEHSKFFAKILAKVTGGTAVLLTDFQDETYITIARKFGERGVAPIYYGTNVGKIYLEADGSVKEHYVKKWEIIK